MATKKCRVYVEVTAIWGNGDASSSIKLSRRKWAAILMGEEYTKSTWSWYEGGRCIVTWSFEGGRVSIDGEDGMQCVVDTPVSELIACVSGGEP